MLLWGPVCLFSRPLCPSDRSWHGAGAICRMSREGRGRTVPAERLLCAGQGRPWVWSLTRSSPGLLCPFAHMRTRAQGRPAVQPWGWLTATLHPDGCLEGTGDTPGQAWSAWRGRPLTGLPTSWVQLAASTVPGRTGFRSLGRGHTVQWCHHHAFCSTRGPACLSSSEPGTRWRRSLWGAENTRGPAAGICTQPSAQSRPPRPVWSKG